MKKYIKLIFIFYYNLFFKMFFFQKINILNIYFNVIVLKIKNLNKYYFNPFHCKPHYQTLTKTALNPTVETSSLIF